jgi:hypothetical protein
MQAVVDHRKRFMSYSIRSGSQNDKSLFNRSVFGQTAHQRIPEGCYFLGDAGYKLYEHLMTPYTILPGMPAEEANFNYLHSRTRIAVEQAFGIYKNRFRCFQVKLLHHNPSAMANLIASTMVLHNWMIDLGGDEEQPVDPEDWMHIGGDIPLLNLRNQVDGVAALFTRDYLKDYLSDL